MDTDEEKKKEPLIPSAPQAPLSRELVTPETRPAVPLRRSKSAAVANLSPDFEMQCAQVYDYFSEIMKRALLLVPKMHPFMARKGSKPHAAANPTELTRERLQQLYAQIQCHDFDFEQENMFFANESRQSPFNPKLTFKAKACMQGPNCLAIQAGMLDIEAPEDEWKAPPFKVSPMMMFMTRKELDEMYRTGAVPSRKSTCLRCLRYLIGSAVIEKEALRETWPPSLILQFFGNKLDAPQGYARRYCLIPSATDFNGLHLPLAQDYDNMMCVRFDPTTRGYFVDQSGLAAKEHPIAHDYPLQIWEALKPVAPPLPPTPSTSGSLLPPTKKARTAKDFPVGATTAAV